MTKGVDVLVEPPNRTFRSWLKSCCPPILLDALRQTSRHGFFPADEFVATDPSSGWGSEELIQHFLDRHEALRSGASGEAVLPPRFSLVANAFFRALGDTAVGREEAIRVADWGGGVGEYYYNFRQLHPSVPLDWTILEQVNFVKALRKHDIQTLRWRVKEELDTPRPFHLGLAIGFLQCIPDPYDTLREICAGSDHVVISTIPLVAGDADLPSLRRVKVPHGESSYPLWFFSESRFKEELRSMGEVLFWWRNPQDGSEPHFKGELVRYYGCLLRPRESLS